MDIRLVAVDLDGTLLKNDRTLSPHTVQAVERAIRHGVEVAFATGRSLCELRELLDQLPAVRYAVTCTGAQVLDCRAARVLADAPLSAAKVRLIRERLGKLDVLLEVYQGGRVWVDAAQYLRIGEFEAACGNPTLRHTRTPRPNLDPWLATQERPVTKVHMYFLTTADRDAALDALEDLPMTVCTSSPLDVEVMARGVDKGTGLACLARHLDLEPEQILAVGDSGNDLAMLTYAGVCAVMANGDADLLAMADIIADTNEHDGVARLLDSLLSGTLEAPRPTGLPLQ